LLPISAEISLVAEALEATYPTILAQIATASIFVAADYPRRPQQKRYSGKLEKAPNEIRFQV
jgi:hypothetical protein